MLTRLLFLGSVLDSEKTSEALGSDPEVKLRTGQELVWTLHVRTMGPAGRDISAPSFLKFTKGKYRPHTEVEVERQPSPHGLAPAHMALPPQQWSWVSPSFQPGIFRGHCGPGLARRRRVSRSVGRAELSKGGCWKAHLLDGWSPINITGHLQLCFRSVVLNPGCTWGSSDN